MIGRPDLADMVVVKMIFFTCLYLLIAFLEKRDNYLCGAILGLIAGMGMTVTWMNAMAILEYSV